MKVNEAPEKLYIDFRDRAESTWRCAYTEKVLANDIEYIRKDALLEWAKIKQTQCLENSTAHAYFQIFIDKINCM